MGERSETLSLFIKNYSIIIKDFKTNTEVIKIGRTFQPLKQRLKKSLVQVYKCVKIPHIYSVIIESHVLSEFESYGAGETGFTGKTECFLMTLPIQEVIKFIDTEISRLGSSTELQGSETTGEVEPS